MPWSATSRAAASERMRKLHADPEFKAKLTKLHADPEFKAAASERIRKLNADRWQCPAGYEALYCKVRAIVGADAAKAQIAALARNEAARATMVPA